MYAAVPDVRLTVTPDLKQGGSSLLWVDLSGGHSRLGGSAFAQVFNQLGNVVPDVHDSAPLSKAFNAVQSLLEHKLILSGHDISDGGLLVTLLEMAFSGNLGWKGA